MANLHNHLRTIANVRKLARELPRTTTASLSRTPRTYREPWETHSRTVANFSRTYRKLCKTTANFYELSRKPPQTHRDSEQTRRKLRKLAVNPGKSTRKPPRTYRELVVNFVDRTPAPGAHLGGITWMMLMYGRARVRGGWHVRHSNHTVHHLLAGAMPNRLR